MEPTLGNIERISQYLTEAETVEDTARSKLSEAQECRRFWTKLNEQLHLERPAAALLTSRTDGAKLIDGGLVDRLGATLIASIRDECEAAASQTARAFGRSFPDAVRNMGIEIDSTSRHPKYTVKQGFIEIAVDERNYTAIVTPRDGNKITMGLDVNPIVAALKEEVDRLFGRRYPSKWPSEFLRTLFNAYTAVLRSEKRSPGEDIPLRRVTNRLSKNLNKFAPDEFNVDLAEVIKRDLLKYKDHKIELQHTRHPRQGMLLHGLEDGGYLGFISFKKGN